MNHYIAIDIGGTKTSSAILNAHSKELLNYESVKSNPGYHIFPKFLGELIKKQLNNAVKRSINIDRRVLVALPGNFETGEEIYYKSGSGRQILLKHEEFDSLNITSWLTAYVPQKYNFFAMNDAKAQAIGAISSTWRDEFKHQVVLFISPGTGLGGALVKMGDDPKDFEFICDGHIYDIIVNIRDQKVMAEDILSGRGIFEKTGKVAKAINRSDDLFNQHLNVVDDCATCCIELIQTISSSSVTKINPKNNWTNKEQQMAAMASVIILGGSIGTKGKIARYIKERLNKLSSFTIVSSHDPDKNALRGTLLIAQKN